MKERRRARVVRIAAPSLVLVAVVAAVIVVLISGNGSSPGACPGEKGASSAGARHCHHSVADVPVAAGLGQGRTGGTGAPGQGEDPGSGGGPASGVGGAVSAAAAGVASGAGAAAGSAGGGNGGTAAGGSAGTGHPNNGGGGGSSASPAAANPTAAANAGSSPAVTSNGVLAPGRSETGSWSATSTVPTEMEPQFTAGVITFPIHLAHPLREPWVTYVSEAETQKPGSSRSAEVKAACGEAGTLAAPTANPGHLCVYSASEDFRDRDSSGGIPLRAGHPFVDAEFEGIVNHWDSPGADKTGARVAFGVPDIRTPEEEAKQAYPHITAHGTWAVTEPLTLTAHSVPPHS